MLECYDHELAGERNKAALRNKCWSISRYMQTVWPVISLRTRNKKPECSKSAKERCSANEYLTQTFDKKVVDKGQNMVYCYTQATNI